MYDGDYKRQINIIILIFVKRSKRSRPVPARFSCPSAQIRCPLLLRSGRSAGRNTLSSEPLSSNESIEGRFPPRPPAAASPPHSSASTPQRKNCQVQANLCIFRSFQWCGCTTHGEHLISYDSRLSLSTRVISLGQSEWSPWVEQMRPRRMAVWRESDSQSG